MERLKNMKESLVNCVQAQISGNLSEVDSKELGEAVDMIKDLEEAIYYHTITEAMSKNEKEGQQHHEPMYYPIYPQRVYPQYPDYRDMDRDTGRMYYPVYYDGQGGNGTSNGGGRGGSSNGNSSSNGSMQYSERRMPPMMMDDSYPNELMRDRREGRSPMSRKGYMEAKEMHHGKEVQMKELEKYMQELGSDITEMIQDASPEEKQMLQQKLSLLVTKIK